MCQYLTIWGWDTTIIYLSPGSLISCINKLNQMIVVFLVSNRIRTLISDESPEFVWRIYQQQPKRFSGLPSSYSPLQHNMFMLSHSHIHSPNETTTGHFGLQYLAKGHPDMQPKTRNELMTTPSEDDWRFLLSLICQKWLSCKCPCPHIYFFWAPASFFNCSQGGVSVWGGQHLFTNCSAFLCGRFWAHS